MTDARKPEQPHAGKSAVQDERQKAWQLSRVVDLICLLLASPSVSVVQACRLIHLTKRFALMLFPDKEAVFEIVYRRRFNRVISERMSRSPEYLN